MRPYLTVWVKTWFPADRRRIATKLTKFTKSFARLTGEVLDYLLPKLEIKLREGPAVVSRRNWYDGSHSRQTYIQIFHGLMAWH